MLVLTRKQNEKIQIGDGITITVVRTKGKTVRLGIQAPPSMRVLRGEIATQAGADSAVLHATLATKPSPSQQTPARDHGTGYLDQKDGANAASSQALRRVDRRQICRSPIGRAVPAAGESSYSKARERAC